MDYIDLRNIVHSPSQLFSLQCYTHLIITKKKANHEAYQAEVEGLRLDNAQVDGNDCLILDEKNGYKFTKENIKKLTAQVKELGEKEFEFKPIEVINVAGLEDFNFLEDWTTGITFVKEEEEEL